MTYQQADQLHESWRKVETHRMTVTDFICEALRVQNREVDAEVLFPPGWLPPGEREKAKEAGA